MLNVDFGILTTQNLSSKESGKWFLELLLDSAPNLAPEKYGHYEPLKHEFDRSNLIRVLDSWHSCFLWKRTLPKTKGSVWTSGIGIHSAIYVSTENHSTDSMEEIEFFKTLSTSTSADFGYLNLFTKDENKTYPYEMIMPFRQGITTHELRKYIPNVAWAMTFGKPYIRLFGRQRLLDCPAFLVAPLNNNLIYVQLTENLYDLKKDFKGVDQVRRRVKEHLNSNAFYNTMVGADYSYKVPDFSF